MIIDSRRISDLNPILQVLTKRLLTLAELKGLRIGVSCTLRDIETQNQLYAQGRTKPGEIVTNVKGGYSYHNWGLAVDIVPLDSNGNLSWPGGSPVWKQLGEISGSLGMEWGGGWTNPVDLPHHQITFGYSCSNFVQGTVVPKVIALGCKDKRLVKFVQTLLDVEADGIFGSATQNAVKKYNSSGVIDAETLDRLIEQSSKQEEVETKDRYNTIQELPSWAVPTIQKLIDKGFLRGREGGLDLSEDMLRIFVVDDRAGLY